MKWLGAKTRMTQIFTTTGETYAITLLKIFKGFIIQQNFRLNTLTVGYQFKSPIKCKKPNLYHFEKFNFIPFKLIKTYKIKKFQKFSLGQIIDSTNFKISEVISVRGRTIGKGFSGTCKRYNFNSGPLTHGSKNHRKPGSIGQGSTPGRVFPGKKLAGNLGNNYSTLFNLPIIALNYTENFLIIKGITMGTLKTNLLINKI
uniref:Large ribosomal subunit protein uL3c n=1 Tax=Pteridomonas danica TaxID=38822 RepID=A0A7T1C5B2_9STRA|nr:ribosomal protein L3 [Pteridomonas danica]QPM99290.1 ribosomal protein L3 [Pteridomonas danica]